MFYLTILGFSQDLETGCPKLAMMKFLDIQYFKGDNLYSDFHNQHKHVLTKLTEKRHTIIFLYNVIP